MDKQQILQLASASPGFEQAVAALQEQMQRRPIAPEKLDELVQMFEFALDNPEAYPQVRQAAIADGLARPETLPEQFNEAVLISVLAALYIVQEQQMGSPVAEAAPAQFARGGLAQAAERLRRQGRNGDTVLAHINPREAEMLRRAGGSGTINPETGLPEFFLDDFFEDAGDFLGAIAPIALSFIAPGLGTAIGSALGASGAAASMLGGAVLGGATSALTGGDALQGALMGGLGGGLGTAVGGAASDALGLGLGATGQAILGSGLVGGAAGALSGQGFAKGALQGAAGQAIGNAVGGTGGETFGNMMTAGYDPKSAVMGGALSGLASGMLKPSQVAVENARNGSGLKPGSSVEGLRIPEAQMVDITGGGEFKPSYALAGGEPVPETGALKFAAKAGVGMPAQAAAAPKGFGFNADTAMKLLPVAGLLGGKAPAAAQQAVSAMSPAQQEYFNRPSQAFDWDRMQRDAASAGLDLTQYMARNWNKIASGTYNQPVQRPGLAQGGALSTVARMARGAGSGRADTIDARLSDGEFVMDAETVAMLGDGSTQEGAKRLEEMRRNLRAHKGKALARGKFSPNAKSPLAYLKESK
jgi:hypothetical protein